MEKKIELGDTVSFDWNGGYGHGTVSQVHADGTVDVFRPYTATAGFSMTGSQKGSSAVICYVGVETSKNVNPSRLKLVEKSKPLR